jgi:hypothetical protein
MRSHQIDRNALGGEAKSFGADSVGDGVKSECQAGSGEMGD